MKYARAICVGLLAATFTSGLSAAADLAPGYPQPIPRAPVYYPNLYSWTGFYLGINGGGGWGSSQWDGVGQFGLSGGFIGGTIGYNWQILRFLIGAEGDVEWSDIRGTTTTFCPLGCTTHNYWLATVRGRLGYTFDRFLPYVTGGLAVGDINASIPGFPGGSISNAGWTIGAGLEVGVLPNISLKAEYLFVDLASFNCGLNCGLLANGNVSLYANEFRPGMNVHF